MSDQALREHLVDLLEGRGAHVDFDQAVRDLPAELRGARPEGCPHSPWQLLEHLRLAQWDLLDFCRNPDYAARSWPADYWPEIESPPNDRAWDASVAAFRADLQAMCDLVRNPTTNLYATVPWGDGQTFLKEALLTADHNAYHLGQLVMLRKMLGPGRSGRRSKRGEATVPPPGDESPGYERRRLKPAEAGFRLSCACGTPALARPLKR